MNDRRDGLRHPHRSGHRHHCDPPSQGRNLRRDCRTQRLSGRAVDGLAPGRGQLRRPSLSAGATALAPDYTATHEISSIATNSPLTCSSYRNGSHLRTTARETWGAHAPRHVYLPPAPTRSKGICRVHDPGQRPGGQQEHVQGLLGCFRGHCRVGPGSVRSRDGDGGKWSNRELRSEYGGSELRFGHFEYPRDVAQRVLRIALVGYLALRA